MITGEYYESTAGFGISGLANAAIAPPRPICTFGTRKQINFPYLLFDIRIRRVFESETQPHCTQIRKSNFELGCVVAIMQCITECGS